MFFNIKIFSTKPPKEKDLYEIADVFSNMKGYSGARFALTKLDISKLKTKKYPDGDVKVDWESFNPFVEDGVDGVNAYCISLTKAEGKKLGIKGVKGSYDADHDNTMEFFVVANNTDKIPQNRTKYSNDWIRVFLHEFSHGCERFLKGYESQLTHEWDYEKKNLTGLYKQWDWTEWSKKKTLLDKLKKQYADLFGAKLIKPVPEKYWGNSQDYGVKSTVYKRTGTHIGEDHACPVGTKVVAPANGRIVAGGLSTELGQYVIYEYVFKGKTYWERYAHLSDKEVYGNFKAGEQIGLTGNTGLSTGPHLHQEVWTIYPDISKITKDNYAQFTIDPIVHYV